MSFKGTVVVSPCTADVVQWATGLVLCSTAICELHNVVDIDASGILQVVVGNLLEGVDSMVVVLTVITDKNQRFHHLILTLLAAIIADSRMHCDLHTWGRRHAYYPM